MNKKINTRSIVKAAIIISILVCISLLTDFIRINGTFFQITDGIYIALCAIIPGYLMLIVGVIYSPMMDLISGSFIYIPITILIHALMWLTVFLLKKRITSYGSFIISALLILIYVPYTYLINMNYSSQNSITLTELITDSIQVCVTIIISCMFYYITKKTNIWSIINK